MTELTDKEFEAILQLNSDYRKAMFLKSVNENNGLYVLVDDDGPLILEDTEADENNIMFSVVPVWSHERLAQKYAKENEMTSMKAQFITRNVWNEKWVPMLKEQPNVLIGFMPVLDKDFDVDDPKEL